MPTSTQDYSRVIFSLILLISISPRTGFASPCGADHDPLDAILKPLSTASCATQVLGQSPQAESDAWANLGGCMIGAKDGVEELGSSLKNAGSTLVEGTVRILREKGQELQNFGRLIRSLATQPRSTAELKKLAAAYLIKATLHEVDQFVDAHQTLQAFKEGASEYLEKHWKEFPCLPEPEKARLRCKMLIEFASAPRAFAQGVPVAIQQSKQGYETAKAMHELIQRTKGAQGLQEASLPERIQAATQAAVMRDAEFKTIISAKEMRIQEYVDPYGKHYFKAERKIKTPDGKQETWHGRKVDLDKNTRAFNATDEETRDFIETLVNQQPNRYSMIYMDVNHLGKMNYPSNATGDAYLKAFGSDGVAKTLKHAARDSDILVKLGGDEFLLLVDHQSPTVVKEIAQRIVANLDESNDANALFREKIVDQGNLLKGIKKAQSIEELPVPIRQSLGPEQLEQGKVNFEQLKPELMEKQRIALKEQAKYGPSISVGSRIIQPGEDFKTALQAAEDQATQVKIEYKAARGLATDKYDGVERRLTDKPDYRAIPKVQDPL